MIKKGLLVSYWFPPINTAASHRTRAIAKHFNLNPEIELDVLCPERDGDKMENIQYLYSHKESSKVSYSHFQSDVSRLKRIKDYILYDLLKIQILLQLVGGVFYKNSVRVLNGIDLETYDFVICSYGPMDVLKIGLHIKSKAPRINLVLDYRDHLSLNPMTSYKPWSIFIRRFEQKVLSKASLIVGVSNKLVESLRNEFKIACSTEVIYNGFNSDNNFPDVTIPTTNTKYLVHAGALYGGKRSCDAFLKFYKNNLENEFELQFAIIHDEDRVYLENLASKYSLNRLIILQGLSYQASLNLIENAHAALLVLSESGIDSEYLPVKMYEYIQLSKGIVFCGDKTKSEAFELISKFNLGNHFLDFKFNQEKVDYMFGKAQTEFNREYQVNKFSELILSRYKK